MGKKIKKNDNDLYQIDQVNKKHRGKSEKIAKRIEKKRNKKKIKVQRFEKRTLSKYLIKRFHEHKKKIDINRLPFDFDEIELTIKKIISHKDKESIERLLRMFNQMEKNPKEVSVSTFENKSIIKDVCKLMRVLRVRQNPKNEMKYSLYHMFQKRNIKARYTTSIEEIIPECLDSYFLLVKSLFEYYSKEEKEKDAQIEEDKEKIVEEKEDKKEDDSFDKERFILDTEYEAIENQVGRNAELINKAFNKLINDNGLKKKKEKEEEQILLEKHSNTNLNDLDENKPENIHKNQIKGPSASDFLKMTMGLLN